jgi:hypothetical protein
MALGVWCAALFIVPTDNRTLLNLFWGVGGCIVAGLCIYGVSSFFIKSPELDSVMAAVKKGIRKK